MRCGDSKDLPLVRRYFEHRFGAPKGTGDEIHACEYGTVPGRGFLRYGDPEDVHGGASTGADFPCAAGFPAAFTLWEILEGGIVSRAKSAAWPRRRGQIFVLDLRSWRLTRTPCKWEIFIALRT